jgi:hypothetical protein
MEVCGVHSWATAGKPAYRCVQHNKQKPILAMPLELLVLLVLLVVLFPSLKIYRPPPQIASETKRQTTDTLEIWNDYRHIHVVVFPFLSPAERGLPLTTSVSYLTQPRIHRPSGHWPPTAPPVPFSCCGGGGGGGGGCVHVREKEKSDH